MRDDVAPIHLGLGAFLLTVFAPFGLGYFLSYFYRAVNAVVAPDLVRDVGLTASGLGFLTATYLVSFAAFQLPLGILLDRFGPRRVQAALLCLTALGATIFGLAASFPALAVSRAMIGVGSAGGLISGFKAVSLTVPEQRQPLANASVMAVGAVGLIFATIPTEIVAAHWGWRSLFVALAAMSLLIALLIFAAAPEGPSRDAGQVTFLGQARGVGTVLSNPVFWRLAPLVAAVCGCQIGIQTLWAGPWLADVAGLDRPGVAEGLAWMATGFSPARCSAAPLPTGLPPGRQRADRHAGAGRDLSGQRVADVGRGDAPSVPARPHLRHVRPDAGPALSLAGRLFRWFECRRPHQFGP